MKYLIDAKKPQNLQGVVSFSKLCPDINITEVQAHALCKELKDLGLIAYTYGVNSACKIFPAGQLFYEDEGGFQKLQKIENEKEKLQYEQLEYSVDKLKKELADYQETRDNARTSLFISKVSIGLSIGIPLLLLLLKWKCNVPSG